MTTSYDDWKTHNPDDDLCEHCGVHPRDCGAGWQPEECTGECGRVWRDPDEEYERQRDDGERFERYDNGEYAAGLSRQVMPRQHGAGPVKAWQA